jgi:hypothetical protein
MKVKAVNVPGIVVTLVTMSDIGDEIDWELLLSDTPKTPCTTNVFKQRIQDFGIRYAAFPAGNSTVDQFHGKTFIYTTQI